MARRVAKKSTAKKKSVAKKKTPSKKSSKKGAKAKKPATRRTTSRKRTAKPAVSHPGMLGDGTEEQNLNETGNPKARISSSEVEAAFKPAAPKSDWGGHD